MINLVLINMLLNNREAVKSALTDETWIELEKKGLGEKVEEYLEGSMRTGRMLMAIRRAYGKDSKTYQSLYDIYVSMRSTTTKYARLTITIPPSVNTALDLFKMEGGKKSQFASACMDNIIAKLNGDTKSMLQYVKDWMITERQLDPQVPDSAFKVREQKAKLDEKSETRIERRARLLTREQEEFDSMRSKEEIESRKRQQKAINELIEDFKRKHEGRKPTREEYTELMMSAKKRHPIVLTDKKNPTTIEAIENARKKQVYINKQEEKKLEKKKKKKTNGDQNRIS